jgi:hypothetical protein
MSFTESIVANILESKSIVEYLEQKGITPVKKTPGRLFYCCPFPDHKETKPSFVVYTNGAFENFYCFGCQAKYHIIHLVAKLDNISYKEAVAKLADGAEVSEFDETEFLVDNKWQKTISHPFDALGVSDALLIASEYCRFYEEGVDRDPAEVKRLDDFWSLIDECLLESDLNTLTEDISPNVIRKWLKGQRARFESEKRKRKMEQLANGR